MSLSALTPPDRELPSHEVHEFAPQKHSAVVVIPVINEGERITRQLQAIAALGARADIVVADGGSTDGSLEPGFLKAVGVRALIVKTGSGQLSAQLRAAYAWCLDHGYEHVVTIDGNGKDGVEAIPRFIELLEAGYDYVQGSRYLKGGVAEHTPLDREIAGRLIHAPLISLAARRFYTDTTNGFRGYSARFLNDPRVAPFRNVFDRYQLLFYLSVRAGQLGFRTTETPVARRYPANAPAPTKIAGWSGRLAMLGELWAVVRGRFAPTP